MTPRREEVLLLTVLVPSSVLLRPGHGDLGRREPLSVRHGIGHARHSTGRRSVVHQRPLATDAEGGAVGSGQGRKRSRLSRRRPLEDTGRSCLTERCHRTLDHIWPGALHQNGLSGCLPPTCSQRNSDRTHLFVHALHQHSPVALLRGAADLEGLRWRIGEELPQVDLEPHQPAPKSPQHLLKKRQS